MIYLMKCNICLTVVTYIFRSLTDRVNGVNRNGLAGLIRMILNICMDMFGVSPIQIMSNMNKSILVYQNCSTLLTYSVSRLETSFI